MKTPILGGYAVARSVNAADNRIVNLYPEATPEGGKSSGFLTRCPGYKFVANVGIGPIRGLWQFGGSLYVVSGVELYRVNDVWAATLLGTVSGSGPVSMSDNGEQLFVACNPRSYTYNAITGQFAEITDEDFPGAVTVGFINGYFVFNEPNSQKVWITSYQNGSSIDPLEFAYTDANPDNLLSLVVNRNEIWMFGNSSTEVWYYSGDVDFPLTRIQGAFNEIGCAAPYSVAKLDNTVFWLGSDPRGNAIVYKAVGYGAQRVSTHGIEKIMQSYQFVGDAIGYSYQQEGHTFYVLIFPSANATWVFDAATNEWHERASWVNGDFNRHRSNCQANFNNTIVLGDFQLGKLYEFDMEYYKDDVGVQRWVRSWRALPPNSNNLNRTAHHSLQVEFESGTKTIQDFTYAPIPPSSSIVLNSPAIFSRAHSTPELVIGDNGTSITCPIPDVGGRPYYTGSSVKTQTYDGKYYFEVEYTVKDANKFFGVGVGITPWYYYDRVGFPQNFPSRASIAYWADNNVFGQFTAGIYAYGVPVLDLSAFGQANQGDIIMIAIDLPLVSGGPPSYIFNTFSFGTMWAGKNGVWLNGNPSTLTGGTQFMIPPQNTDVPIYSALVSISAQTSTEKATANFGGSSFTYAVPSGFLPWATDNPSLYNQLDPSLKGTENYADVTPISILRPAITTEYRFVRSKNSGSYGKRYFEASGWPGSGQMGNPLTRCMLSLAEGGCPPHMQPAGQGEGFLQTWARQEKCCIDFVAFDLANPTPNLTSLMIGQKYDAATNTYVSSNNPLTGLKKCKQFDRLMVAIDFDAGKAWFGVNGRWSGDPEGGTGEAWTFTPNTELYVLPGIDILTGPLLSGTGHNVSVYMSPTLFENPLPLGYNVFNSSGLSVSSTNRLPRVLLRWSDDGGHTWSNYYDKDLGGIGAYGTRVIWRRLGMTTEIRDRVYELSCADDVKVAITGAELKLSGTTA